MIWAPQRCNSTYGIPDALFKVIGLFKSAKCLDVNEWEGLLVPSDFFRGL